MNNPKTGTGEQSPEPFRIHAGKYLDAGLSVFPCGGDNGKIPLVKWKPLQTNFIGSNALDKWLTKFPAANIAIVTGEQSGITVIDSDNPKVSPRKLFDIYGETPLVVKTPSGGKHLYYRYNGEGNSQDSQNKIDIKGQGGFVVAPPSYNPNTGKTYNFIEGDLWDIEHLPIIKNNNEIQRRYNEGERNKGLFDYLKKEAQTCHDISALTGLAYKFNQQNINLSLEEKEIERTVASVWKYKQEGRLFVAGKKSIVLDMEKMQPFMFDQPRAFALYVDLISCHRGVNETFAIAATGYKKRCGWDEKTTRQEIKTLMSYELIELVYKGGNKPHDPSIYKFI